MVPNFAVAKAKDSIQAGGPSQRVEQLRIHKHNYRYHELKRDEE